MYTLRVRMHCVCVFVFVFLTFGEVLRRWVALVVADHHMYAFPVNVLLLVLSLPVGRGKKRQDTKHVTCIVS